MAKAIYATRAREGTLWSEGDTIRYTRSKDRRFIYAILTEWPGAQVTLKTMRPKDGTRSDDAGVSAELAWKFDSAGGTTITLPENLQQPSNRPCDYAWTLKMEAGEG